MTQYSIIDNENGKTKKISTISIMLDLYGTCDGISSGKAAIFANQIEWLRKKFNVDYATICIATTSRSKDEMVEILNMLDFAFADRIKICRNFFLGGFYDFDKKQEVNTGLEFSMDKEKKFSEYYLENENLQNKWFSIIDDEINGDLYQKYQNNHPMLLGIPSSNEENIRANNFMKIASTAQGFDGVIDILNNYIDEIKHLTYKQILKRQKQIIPFLSDDTIALYFSQANYSFLKKYFMTYDIPQKSLNYLLGYFLTVIENKTLSNEEVNELSSFFQYLSRKFNDEQDYASSYHIKRCIKELPLKK